MASFFTWWLLENWVSKTRFINQKNLSLKRSLNLTGSDQIRERKSQIREKETKSERERKSSHGLRRTAQVVRPASRDLGLAWPSLHDLGLSRPGLHDLGLAQPGSRGLRFAGGSDFFWVFSSSSSFYFFIFLSFWLWFHFCWCCCFVIYSLINRVFKTWFSSSRHVEYDATSDVNRPWKSILLYSNC